MIDRQRRRRFAGVACVGVVAVVLMGCAAPSPTSQEIRPVEDFAGVPDGTYAPPGTEPGTDYAVWTTDGKHIGIVLFGSSSCPERATKMTVPEGFLESTVALAPPDRSKTCTTDSAPHTTLFDAPEFFRANGSDVMIGLLSGKVVLSHGGGN
ncbi:hypothetical protein [Leifsonia sp. NPDC080035]|uniref:Lipoprotein n=1 Tax=Leifsonia sp. NPDC080035 TaxID=3143936 RepID=A0AAU7GEP6_9MICO